MYCSNCGKELPAGRVKYCPNCGAKVEHASSHEDIEVVVGDDFPTPVFQETPSAAKVKKGNTTVQSKAAPPKSKVVEEGGTSPEKPSIGKSLWLQTATNLLAAFQHPNPAMTGIVGFFTILNLTVGLIFNKKGGSMGKVMKVSSALLALIQGGSVAGAILNLIEYPFLADNILIGALSPLAAFATSMRMLFVKIK